MLLRGVFSFEPRPEDHYHTLPFSCNDRLIFLKVHRKDPNWLQAVDFYGRIGYIPKIMVRPDEYYADPDLIQTFLVDAVVNARQKGLESASNLEGLRDELREKPEIIQERAHSMLKIYQGHYANDDDDANNERKKCTTTNKAKKSTSEQQLTSNSKRIANRAKASVASSAVTGKHELRRAGSESELEIGHQYYPHHRKSIKPQAVANYHPPLPAQSKPKSNYHHRQQQQRRPYDWETENDGYASGSTVRTPHDDHQQQQQKHAQYGLHESQKISLGRCNENDSISVIPASSPSLQAIRSTLVNVVQETSGLDCVASENVLNGVFQCIKDSTSKIPVPVESLFEKLSLSAAMSFAVTPNKVMSELENTMNTLTKMSKTEIRAEKQGSSSRSRAHISSAAATTFEQQEFIEKLDKLKKLLVDCDTVHATQLLQLGQHSFSHNFVHLYDLESPESVRERMLDIFLIICKLDKKGRVTLLPTTLPIYLARDLMAQTGGGNGRSRNERKLFIKLVNILTLLFSCGETMPDTHFEIIGTGFANFLLKEVEQMFTKIKSETLNDKIPNNERLYLMINLILAYNLQFLLPSKENLVLKVLSEQRKRPRTLYITILELLKKAKDPLHSVNDDDGDDNQVYEANNFSFSKPPLPHSVFKIVSDICSCKQTASLFNDSTEKDNTLMEIIVDGLFSNHAGNTRLGYIQVLRAHLTTLSPEYLNLRNLRTVLLNILLDSDPLAIREQQEIRGMSKEFPGLFVRSISKIKVHEDTRMMNESNTSAEEQDFNEYFYISS